MRPTRIAYALEKDFSERSRSNIHLQLSADNSKWLITQTLPHLEQILVEASVVFQDPPFDGHDIRILPFVDASLLPYCLSMFEMHRKLLLLLYPSHEKRPEFLLRLRSSSILRLTDRNSIRKRFNSTAIISVATNHFGDRRSRVARHT